LPVGSIVAPDEEETTRTNVFLAAFLPQTTHRRVGECFPLFTIGPGRPA
jgi:hypothetical protein